MYIQCRNYDTYMYLALQVKHTGPGNIECTTLLIVTTVHTYYTHTTCISLTKYYDIAYCTSKRIEPSTNMYDIVELEQVTIILVKKVHWHKYKLKQVIIYQSSKRPSSLSENPLKLCVCVCVCLKKPIN